MTAFYRLRLLLEMPPTATKGQSLATTYGFENENRIGKV
jgi:hypothetical protein